MAKLPPMGCDADGGESPADSAVSAVSAVSADWWVYVLISDSAHRTYVGVTTDPERRIAEHNGERPGGARSTRAGRPWTLGRLHGPFAGRSEAQALEHQLRRRRGAARLAPGIAGG